jgi:elongation factor Ts
MNITADTVKQLRERTGAGMMECKKALVETKGDLDAAAELMRKSGLAKADKKAARIAAEGTLAVERADRSAVMVELNCETDFVARNDEFKQLAKDLALHIMAANPLCVRREDVPQDVIAEQKRIFMSQVADKPANIQEKIAEGKLNAWFGESVLLDQKFVKDETKTVREVILAVNSRTGENISVARFARFKVGEAR